MKHKKNYSLPAAPWSSFFSSPQPKSSSNNYVELLARSCFSFLAGASHPDEMVLTARELGYRGLALCDLNGLYGVARGYQAVEKPSHFDASHFAASKNADFRYHVGAELTPFDSSPVTLLPISKEGYARLSRLITQAKRPAAKGYLKLSLSNVIEDAGQASGELLAIPHPPWNLKDLGKLVDAFGDRLYLPVHRDLTWESIQLSREAMDLERKFGSSGLTLFATQRPLYHEPSRKRLHDVMTCIQHGLTLDQAKTVLTLNSERHLKPLSEIQRLFQDRPDLIARTVEISNRLGFSLSELHYKYPQETLPPGKTSAQHLRDLVETGFNWRYPKKETSQTTLDKARHQVEHELSIIRELEYEDYFLTLWDICDFARSKDILHQGRGSAANSIVCFTLGLTSIDPIKLGLLFERFLSRERAEPPDIDIDFEHERREEVIQYIYRKYGSRHAAMVCTTIRYRSRMALREVSKVMGVSLENTNRLVKAMGREGLSRFIQTHAETPIDPGLFGLSERKFRLILQMADELKGFPRHLGIHTGGFVISHEPVVDIVPVESATMDQRYVIQWNKDDVAALGLMKLDILSLGMLSAIRKAFQMLQESKGLSASLSSIPQEDQDTYKMIQKADTIGTFQIESRAQMSLLPRLKPKTWYDLVVQVAIVRPGPLQGGMVHPYLRRRSGEEKITYAHERLKPILEKTMGVPIFQEQVMQIVVAVAGFTPGESDELRRVVSSAWRKRKVMHGLRQRLINGMLNNGIPSAYAEQIFKVIQGFAEYGFPESHAASFALLTYVSSWLKRHHPDIFATALLNSQPMGFYPPRILIADAKRNGVVFLPLDIQHSDWEYRLTPSNHVLKNVRVGLCSVDGLSEHDIAILINERSRQGAFRDLEDLVRRTRLHKKTLMRLATAGALHSLTKEGEDVRRTLFALQGIDFNQQSFFYGISPSNEGCSGIPIETEWESIVREFQTKGFSLTNHPIGLLRGIPGLLKGYKTAQDLPLLPNGTQVKIIGLRSLLQKPPTASGVCFASLEDETGIFNVIVMPDVYERVRLTLYNHGLLEIKGRLEIKKGVVHIRATDVSPLREGNGLPSEPHRYYG